MSNAESPLVSRLIGSGLVSREQLDKCRAAAGAAASDDQLLDLLLKVGLQTKWQAVQIQAGKERGLVLDHYKLLDPVGAGGMGQVFRALDVRTNRHVAVKLLPKRLATPTAIERFRREGRAALEVQHEHIVRSFELGKQGDTHFLVMELIEGTNLARYIAKHGVLSAREATRIGFEVARALDYARQLGIIHRDIKPSNILLTRQGRVKLTDLGLAKFFGDAADNRPDTLTHSGAFMGTIDYCAPEQAEDAKRADTRSDIYSLGCTLYHCLTGRAPFDGGSSVQKIVAHREQEPTPIREFNPEVPQLLADLILRRMLAKQPDDRFQTPAEAADALDPWARGDTSAIDVARLQNLIEEEYAVAPVKSPSSRPSSRSSTRSRSLRRAGPSAIGTGLRSLFVNDVSGGVARLVVLLAVLGGLYWFWSADPFGWKAFLASQPNNTAPPTTPPGMPPYGGAVASAPPDVAPNLPSSDGASNATPSTPPTQPPPGATPGTNMPGASGQPPFGPGYRPGMPGAPGSGTIDLARQAFKQLEREGPAGYRKFCSELLERYPLATTSPRDCNNVAWACVFAPDAVADLSRPVELARRAVAEDSDKANCLNTLGACLYRAGRFQEAVETLNQSIAQQGTGGIPEDWLFLAMAQHKLAQSTVAKESLDKATQLRAAATATSTLGEWKMFLSEASKMIGAGAVANSKTARAPEGESKKSQRRTTELVGNWRGTLTTSKLRLVFMITKKGNVLSGTIVSLDQGNSRITLTRIDLTDDTVRFEADSINGVFAGKMSEDGKQISGEWEQYGRRQSLVIRRD